MATPDLLQGIWVDMWSLVRKKKPTQTIQPAATQVTAAPAATPNGVDRAAVDKINAQSAMNAPKEWVYTPIPLPETPQPTVEAPKPTVATAAKPVIKRTPPTKTTQETDLGYQPTDYSAVDAMDKSGLQDFIDYYTIKQSRWGQLSENDQRQLMRAQRRYADMSVTSPSTAITDEQARLTKERDDYRTKLDARSSDVIAAKQAELESSYAQQKSELRQAGEREREAAQSVLSFSGFGRSTYSAQQQADIQAKTEANMRILDDKKALELEKFKAEQAGANEKLLAAYDTQINNLAAAQAKYLADTALKIDEYNQKSAAKFQDKIDDLLAVASMNMDVNDLTESEINKAKTYGELLIDDSGNINGELLKTLPQRLRAAALAEAAKAKWAIAKEAKTITDGAWNVLQWNHQTGKYDIPVGSNKPGEAKTVEIDDGQGGKITMQYNPSTGRYDIPVNAGYTVPWGDSAELYKILRAGAVNGQKFFAWPYATGDMTGDRFKNDYYVPAQAQWLENYMNWWAQKGSKITYDMVMNSATKFGVDPIAVAATMAFDSSMGTKGKWARNNNPGNVGQFDSLDAKGITVKWYGTLQEGVDAVAQNLRKRLDAYQAKYPQGMPGANKLTPTTEAAWNGKTLDGYSSKEKDRILKELANAGKFDEGMWNQAYLTASPKERGEISTLMEWYMQWKQAKEIIDKLDEEGSLAGYVWPLDNRGVWAVWAVSPIPIRQDLAKLRNILGKTLSKYMKQISGAAISEPEARRLAEQIPNTKMNESTFMAAVDTYNDEIERTMADLFYRYWFGWEEKARQWIYWTQSKQGQQQAAPEIDRSGDLTKIFENYQ